MTQRIGAKGQVVIPKAIRDELGLQPGSEVDFEQDGEGVRIVAAGAAIARELAGSFAGSDMAAALLADRAQEPK